MSSEMYGYMFPSGGFDFEIEAELPDWSDLEQSLMRNLDEGLDALAVVIESLWKEKAALTLKTSIVEYLNGIHVERNAAGITCSLHNWLAIAVENGTDRFDMKPGILKGRTNATVVLTKSGGAKAPIPGKRGDASWWHPGIQARAVFEQVREELDELLSDTLIKRLNPGWGGVQESVTGPGADLGISAGFSSRTSV